MNRVPCPRCGNPSERHLCIDFGNLPKVHTEYILALLKQDARIEHIIVWTGDKKTEEWTQDDE